MPFMFPSYKALDAVQAGEPGKKLFKLIEAKGVIPLAWDPVWFGVMMTVNLAIGTITPPVAVNLYVASNISGASMEEVSRWALPFVLALIAALLLITYIPALSLWLPNLLGVR